MDSSNIGDLGWRGRWLAWRNRLLASARFQRWAARFPLTRPVARQRARRLFDLVAGFTYSQILAACIETRLLDLLAEGALSTAAIASRIDLPVEGAERLLRGAAALGLVERLGSDWMLGSDGAALRGNGGIAAMVAHHRLLYTDLADPVGLLRRGGGAGALSDYWPYAEASGTGSGTGVASYSALMAASQPMVAEQIITAFPFARHRRLLDVGGGEGAFLEAVAARFPALELALFDLPAVGERARARLDSAGHAARTKVFGGDFLNGPLPTGYDLISLVRIVHDHDDPAALALLRNVHTALPPGGTLLIGEPMAGTHGAERAGDAYFGFYLLAMGSGKPRSLAEMTALLQAAGFVSVQRRSTAIPLLASVITARR
jgi:demethylspheroidene O-methyltransferase